MGVLLGVAATFGVGTAASAMTASPSEVQPTAQSTDSTKITPGHIEGAAAELENAGYHPEVIDGVRVYDLGEGRRIGLPLLDQSTGGGTARNHPTAGSAAPAPRVHNPDLGGGVLADNSGTYLDLNRTDQEAIMNGSSAAIGVLACSATGPLSCALVVGLIGLSITYVNNNGFCPRILRIEADWNGALTRASCR